MDALPREQETEPFDAAGFSRMFGALRPALRSYVMSILPHPDSVDDVVQETSLFLWERRRDFTADTNFKAWAFKAAYFKVLTHRRNLQRSKVVTLSEEIIQRIAGAAEVHADAADHRLDAMTLCLRQLRDADLRLLQVTYLENRTLTEQARDRDVPANRLQKTISRIRLGLRRCIESKLLSLS